MNLFVLGWHVQIIFYTLFAIGIFFIFYFLYSLIKKDGHLKQTIKSAVVFVFAILLQWQSRLIIFTQIYEYTPTQLGVLKAFLGATHLAAKSESDFYQYATNWSFSPGEVLTFIIPSYYGFGNSIYQGPLSQNQPVDVNTYFGQMPFVDVAMYMGVIVFFWLYFRIC